MALEKIHKNILEPVFASEKKKKFSLFGIKKLTAATLVAIILGTLTVSTNAEALEKVMAIVGKIVIKEPLAEKMHVESEEEEENIIVEEIWDGEKTSVQQGKVAVCVEQVISDGEDAYIYLSVELPQYLEVEKWKTGEEKGWDIQWLVEETWELNWSFSCEKMAKSYKAEATIDAHDGTVITKEAVVSPLSVRVTGTMECDDPTYSQVSCYIDGVILKDGTLEEYDANYSQIEEETKKYNMKWYFKHMIPMEDIIGVVVNGEYIYFN